MSKRTGFDQHAADDLRPRRELAEQEQSPDMLLRDAASLLETLGPRSSEARRMAERLRRLAREIAAALRAEAAAR